MQCSMDNLPAITEDHLIYFVTYCKNSLKLKWETIKLYLAGIRYHFLRAGHSDPLEGTNRLHYIMRGIKKSQRNISNNRLPITSEVLRQMCDLLTTGVFSPFIDLLLQCAFKTAFFGFLRCGEITCRLKNDYSNCVYIRDIIVNSEANCYILRLRTSKTDPFREGVDISINENTVLQPVDTMIQYLKCRKEMGVNNDSPLFVESELCTSPLTRDSFISFLRQLLTRLGYKDFQYCGHSFRIGAATSAAAAGVEDHVIQALGRWASDCYIRYIKTDRTIVRNAQEKMCRF